MKTRMTFSCVLASLVLFIALPAFAEKVEICHNGHTIEVNEAAVPAHMEHGDTMGPCGSTEGACLCNESPTWSFLGGKLYCTSTAVTDGRLAVCISGAPACESVNVSDETFELNQCTGCLPATTHDGTTFTDCTETSE